jgi:hemerythrin-like domain-containing protein/rubredoxin
MELNMLPVGPLMVEHRLIERMIALLDREVKRVRRGPGKLDTDFILSAIEFIRFYADRCHHGKEEEILFRELKGKPLTPGHRRTLEELEAEHARGRKTVDMIALVRERVLKGDAAAQRDLLALLEGLVAFYPAHIRKEDEGFFLECMDYFSEAERARILEEEQAFDLRLVHDYFERQIRSREPAPPAGPVPGVRLEGPAGDRFGCMVCGYTYDPAQGDPAGHVPPGTPFDQLPEDWVCPHCHVNRTMFLRLRAG